MRKENLLRLLLILGAIVLPGLSNASSQVGELLVEDGAFTLVSQDKSFLLNAGGRFQMRYWYADIDSNYPYIAPEDTSTFELYQCRLTFKGYAFGPKLSYFMQLDFMAEKILRDGILSYSWEKYLNGKVGYYRPPFTRQRIASGAALLFVRRAIAVDKLAIGRDTGASIYGSLFEDKLSYEAGMWNGESENQRTNTGKYHVYAGRFLVKPFGPMKEIEAFDKPVDGLKLILGGSALYNQYYIGDPDLDGLNEKADDFRWSGELTMGWQRLVFFSEFISKTYDPQVTGLDTIESRGWYAQAGFLAIPDKLQIALRYSWLDPNIANNDDDATDADIEQEMSAGFNYFIHAQRLMVQVNYSHLTKDYADYEEANADHLYGIDTAQEERGMVQLQLIF